MSCYYTTDEHENACPRTCCAQFLIVSRNVNQLLRIFRIVISINSRAIHVYFFSATGFQIRNFAYPEGEGRKRKLKRKPHAWIDDGFASLRKWRKGDGRGSARLERSKRNFRSFFVFEITFSKQFFQQIALKIYSDRKRLKKAAR